MRPERVGEAATLVDAHPSLRVVPAAERAPFEDVLELHASDLRRFIARRVRDRELVDDIAQETLLRAYRARKVFDRGRPFWPWLAMIARNVIYNTLRNENVRRRHIQGDADWRSVQEHEDVHVGVDPVRRFESAQELHALGEVLDSLEQRQRRVLLMRAVDNLSYDEIAATEGLSVDALKSLLKRTRRMVRERYDEIMPDDGVAATAPFLTRLRARLRLRFHRTRARVEQTFNIVRYSPNAESLLQILAAASVAGALALSGLRGHVQPDSRRIASVRSPGAGLTLSDDKPRAAPKPTPREYIVNQTIGAGTDHESAIISFRGGFTHDKPHNRTLHIHAHYDIPGSGRSVDAFADVRCDYGEVHLAACDIIDQPPDR